MADKACLRGDDSPALTRSVSTLCSASENSCATHLAMKSCKTPPALSLMVSRGSLRPYPNVFCPRWEHGAAPNRSVRAKALIPSTGTQGTTLSVFTAMVSLAICFQRWADCSCRNTAPQGTPLAPQGSEHTACQHAVLQQLPNTPPRINRSFAKAATATSQPPRAFLGRRFCHEVAEV